MQQKKLKRFESVPGAEDQIRSVPGAEDQIRSVPIVTGLEDDFEVDSLEELIARGFEATINFLSVGPTYKC